MKLKCHFPECKPINARGKETNARLAPQWGEDIWNSYKSHSRPTLCCGAGLAIM